MAFKSKIEELVNPIIEENGAFLIDVAIRKERGKLFIEIYVDNDNGVTTDLCSSLSREISPIIENANLFKKQYYLVVSSPGIDRPLKFKRQYPKNIGRNIKVKIQSEQQIETLKGKLVQVSDEDIGVKTDNNMIHQIPFVKILQATIEPKL